MKYSNITSVLAAIHEGKNEIARDLCAALVAQTTEEEAVSLFRRAADFLALDERGAAGECLKEAQRRFTNEGKTVEKAFAKTETVEATPQVPRDVLAVLREVAPLLREPRPNTVSQAKIADLLARARVLGGSSDVVSKVVDSIDAMQDRPSAAILYIESLG